MLFIISVTQQSAALDKQRLQKISDIRTRVTAFRSQATRFFGELNVLLDDAQILTNAAFRPDFPSDTEVLRAYARSPVRNCASPFPKLQSAEWYI
jgi:hypothetical protein